MMKYFQRIFLNGGILAISILCIGLFLYFSQPALALHDNCFALADNSPDWDMISYTECGATSGRYCSILIRTIYATTECVPLEYSCIDPILWECTFDCIGPVTMQNCDCDEYSNVSTGWVERQFLGSCSGNSGPCFCMGCEDFDPPYNTAKDEFSSDDCYDM